MGLSGSSLREVQGDDLGSDTGVSMSFDVDVDVQDMEVVVVDGMHVEGDLGETTLDRQI